VVREEEVDAAGVEVDGVAEVLLAHRAALDVPAGATAAPGAVPGVVAVSGLVRFPEREVAAVFLLVGVDGLRFAGEGGAELEFAFLDAREAAVSGKRRHLEIDGAIGGAVGVAVAHEAVDHVDLLADVAGGGGFDVGREAVQRGAVGVEFVGPLPGDLGERAVFVAGALDGFVVDVGEIANVFHLVGAELEFEEAAEDVVDDESAEIADVGRGVDGGAAVVEAVDAVGLAGAEFADLSRERVEELDGHENEKGRWSVGGFPPERNTILLTQAGRRGCVIALKRSDFGPIEAGLRDGIRICIA